MLAQALLSGSVCKNVILKEYIKTKTNPSYLWAMDGCYNNYMADDDFTGIEGDSLNECLWNTETIGDGSAIISNNKAFLTINTVIAWDFTSAYFAHSLDGDFDIQIDISDFSQPNLGSSSVVLQATIEGKDNLVGLVYDASSISYYSRLHDGTQNDTHVNTSNNYGQFRTVRVGSILSTYYSVEFNEDWVLLDSRTVGAEKLESLFFYCGSTAIGHTVSSNFDNFKINSGDVVWKVKEEIQDNHGETINEPTDQQPPLTAYSLPTDKSILINGSTQAIDTNLTVSSQASRTVLMTFEMTDFPEPQLLFSDGDYEGLTKRLHLGINREYWAYIVSDGFETFDESEVHLHNLVVGEKYIVAYVIDGHDGTIYVNGIVSASFTISATIDPAVGVGDLMIGKDGSADLFYGNFYVDLFVVYDEALSLTDIRASAGIFLTGNVCGAPPEQIPPTGENLTQIGSYTDARMNGAQDVAIKDDTAYVISTASGTIASIDISTPTNLQLRNLLYPPYFGTCRNIAISGDIAYCTVADRDKLSLINILDPDNISHRLDYVSSSINGAQGIAISGSIAYVVSDFGDTITSLNISDPDNITVLDTYSDADLNDATGIAINDDYACVVTDTNDTMVVIGLSPGGGLTKVGAYSNTIIESCRGVAIDDGVAYVTSFTNGSITALTISANPSPLSTLANAHMSGASGIKISSGVAYVTGSTVDTIASIDISTPSNLTEVDFLQHYLLDGCVNLAIDGNEAYVAAYAEDSLTAIDIT